jgi:hypothetical protein
MDNLITSKKLKAINQNNVATTYINLILGQERPIERLNEMIKILYSKVKE